VQALIPERHLKEAILRVVVADRLIELGVVCLSLLLLQPKPREGALALRRLNLRRLDLLAKHKNLLFDFELLQL